jgi:uncharacterized protein (DUF924 family)
MDDAANGICRFWIDEVGPAGWYKSDPALDGTIRDRYLDLWETARTGDFDVWIASAESCLALVILLDQFPRNMFRGDARSFASDARSRAIAKSAIARGYDRREDLPGRGFFYLPLMHSETLPDQERAVRLHLMRFGPESDLTHPRAHRLVIRRFGRFPYRNAALGRVTTPPEQEFLDAGGYGAAVREVSK